MNRSLRSSLTLSMVFLLVLTLGASTAQAGDEFLRLADLTRSSNFAAVEAWLVDVDTSPFENHTQTLEIDLFTGKRHVIEATQIEDRGAGDLAWRGRFDDGGQVVLTLKSGFLVGVMFAPDGIYELTTSAQGQVLQKLDQEAFPPCAHEDDAVDPASQFGFRSAPSGEAPKTPAIPGNGLVTIDIMTIYTPQARSAAGGTAQIQAAAQSSIDVSNTAFTNSDTTARFSLVHTAEVSYNDSGNIQADRNWMRSNSTVNALRDQYAADLVGMLVEDGGGYCGIAFLMGNEDPAAFGPNGYQVTARSCAVGNLSYPHEHGHNLGLQHNPQNGAPSSQAVYPWSYGHYVNGSYRTVMSYSNPCGSGCTRQPYFSNPDIVYLGSATGIANSRDNSRTIDLVAPFTAQYRNGGGGGGGGGACSECVDFSSTSTVSYSSQDNTSSGSVQVQDGGATLALTGNRWRRTSQTYTVTANTTIEFDFSSTSQGEIHGIGFDQDDNISNATRVFQVHGTQNWGSANHDFDNYSGSGVTTYTIPVGQYYTGSGMRLVFVNDKDSGTANNTSFFTNVRIFENGGGGGCAVDDDFSSSSSGWTTSGSCSTGTFVRNSPTQQTSTVVTQVGGDHTTGSGNAWFTATNSSAGANDVDGGECVLESPSWTANDASTLSVWYFHGQRDSGDDASGDYFRLEVSTNGGASYSSIVNIGDARTVASWTNATTQIPAGSNVRLRVRASDGAGPGDIIEAGIDDLSVCSN